MFRARYIPEIDRWIGFSLNHRGKTVHQHWSTFPACPCGSLCTRAGRNPSPCGISTYLSKRKVPRAALDDPAESYTHLQPGRGISESEDRKARIGILPSSMTSHKIHSGASNGRCCFILDIVASQNSHPMQERWNLVCLRLG
jgi:hypothetical protein